MRPAGLTAVCIICLIVGLFGSLGLLLSCAGYIAQPMLMKLSSDFQKTLTPRTAQTQQEQQLQETMMQDIAAIQRKWLIPSLAATFVAAVAMAGLIIGAIRGLHLRRMAHAWLIAGMAAAILHAFIASYIGYVTQREIQPIMAQQMTQAMQNAAPGAPPAARAMTSGMMSSAMQVSTAMGMMFIFGWTLLKCAFFAVGIWYLLTPRIRALFEGDGSDRAVIDALSDAPT